GRRTDPTCPQATPPFTTDPRETGPRGLFANAPFPSAGASSTPQPRLDALVEAARRCRDRLPESSGADRYTLHAVADIDVLLRRGDGRAELLDGTPVSVETLRRWACDCGLVRHILK